MKPNEVWQAALGELQLQMTRETFNTWLKPTRLLEADNGVFKIGVENGYVREWLSNRLQGTVVRTVSSVLGREVEVEFVVLEKSDKPRKAPILEGSGPAEPSQNLLSGARDFNPESVGWAPFSRYAGLFWAPLLGRVAWPLYLRVRMDDKRSKDAKKIGGLWTPPRRYYAPELARSVGCGKQAITGVWRKCEPDAEGALRCDVEGWAEFLAGCVDLADRPPPIDGQWRRRQVGALERLAAESAALYEKQGKEPHVFYVVRVRVVLPLLLPEQVARLPALLVTKHDRWIWDHTAFDPLDWALRTEDDGRKKGGGR